MFENHTTERLYLLWTPCPPFKMAVNLQEPQWQRSVKTIWSHSVILLRATRKETFEKVACSHLYTSFHTLTIFTCNNHASVLLLHYLITPFLLYGPLWTHFHLLKSLHIYYEKNVTHTHTHSFLSYKYIRDIQMSSQPLNAASLAPATERHRRARTWEGF